MLYIKIKVNLIMQLIIYLLPLKVVIGSDIILNIIVFYFTIYNFVYQYL